MTDTLVYSRFDQTGFDAFLRSRAEPHWLVEQRQQAWAQYQNMPWPDRRSEEWMRSDLRMFRLERFELPVESSGEADTIETRLGEGVETAGVLRVHDGFAQIDQLHEKYSKLGVIFGSLDRIASEHQDLVKKYLFSIEDQKANRFAALHAATWSGGHMLFVPKGVTVDLPLLIQSTMRDGGTDLGHTLVVLDDDAEATVLYESASPTQNSSGFHNGGLEIILGRGARFRYVNLQDWGRSVWHFAQQRAVLDRDATIQWTIAAMGSKFAQVAQEVDLNGEGSSCQVNGVMFTQDRQQITYNTLQRHCKPHCRSDFLYKAALQDHSRTVWRGMIKVDKGANKTDGYQRNDNLLLSDHCRADSIPGLEIETDDVRCTHGSTSGRVDEELIFYAQSRGFTRREAVRLIVTGFFQQIFDRITIDSVREALGKAIAKQVREYE